MKPVKPLPAEPGVSRSGIQPIETMKNLRPFLTVGGFVLLLGALIGIEQRTVTPSNGPEYSETRFLLPGQKPKLEKIPGDGTSFSTVRYAYGLIAGGFFDPEHLEVDFKLHHPNP